MRVGGWLPARVAAVRPTARHARVLEIDVPGWPGNLPGQHLDIRLTAEDGYQAERSYSLASSGDGERIELGVDEIDTGEVSPYLVSTVEPGDELEVKGPLGGYFVWHADDPSPVQLIGGGSGIVPLLAMARARAAAASEAPFRLLYSVRDPADAMFRDEVDAFDPAAIAVTWVYTREAPAGWTGRVGRLDAAAVRELVVPADAGATVFVCGPTPFVEAVADAVVAAGHDPARVRTERFGGA